MKECPKCKKQHTMSGVYCSRSCANSRNFSIESKKKKSESNKRYWNSLSDEVKRNKISILSEARPFSKETYLQTILNENWDILGIQSKRLRVILEQEGKCNKCGISHWNGERITLEYEHRDGNNQNNNRDNVEALCPNCHSQTKTWRGRKNKGRQKQVESYIDIL